MDYEDVFGQPVPDCEGYSFGDTHELGGDGNIGELPIYGPSGNVVGHAHGVTADALLADGKSVAQRDITDPD